MQRKVRFIVLFVTTLVVISISSFALFLNTVAPFRANTPIEDVRIGYGTSTPVRFFGNIFESCTKTSDITKCSLNVDKRPLEITINYKQLDQHKSPKCQANYVGQNYKCFTSFVGSDGYVGGVRFLNSIYTTSDLGLTSQQLQTLSTDNWFAQLNQTSWSHLSMVLSGICGILAAIIIWQYPNRLIQVSTSLVIGLNIFYLGLVQLSKIKYAWSILQNWNEPQIIFVAGLFATLGTGLISVFNWRRQNWMLPFAIIGGVNVFHLFGLLIYFFLISGGFVIEDY